MSFAFLAYAVLVLTGASRSDYTVRLYFENLSRGTSNVGAVDANTGDLIAIKYSFHGNSPDASWGTFQMTICDSPVIGKFPGWNVQVHGALIDGQRNEEDFLLLKTCQNQQIGDNLLNPCLDDRRMCHGSYLGLGIDMLADRARNWEVTFYTFRASGNEGDELHFSYPGRIRGTGISTRIIDGNSVTADPTDNFVRVHVKRYRLRGQVLFQGLAPGALPPSTAQIRLTPEVGLPFLLQDVPVDADGFFELNVPPERYRVSVRAGSWLRRTSFVQLTDGDIDAFQIALPNGDAFADNVVDIHDLTQILLFFGQPGVPYSDLNRDGTTDAADLNIVLTNFGLFVDL